MFIIIGSIIGGMMTEVTVMMVTIRVRACYHPTPQMPAAHLFPIDWIFDSLDLHLLSLHYLSYCIFLEIGETLPLNKPRQGICPGR